MKKLLIVDTKEGTKARVLGVHLMPFDKTNGVPSEVIDNNILVDEVLQYEGIVPIGKALAHYVNPQTLEQWYELEDRPLTPEEKLQLLEQENQDLKNRIELMQQAMDELLLGGM
jgi:hypothetical protein